MATIDNIEIPSLLLEEGTTPTTPGAGLARLFVDSADGILKWVDDAGTVYASLSEAAAMGTYEPVRALMVAHPSAPTVVAATTFTLVGFDTVVTGDLTGFDTGTHLFTAQADGVHLVSSLVFASVADGQRLILAAYVNGVAAARLCDVSVGAANNAAVGGTAPVKVSAGDTIGIYAWSSIAESFGSSTVAVDTYFRIWGPT